MAKITTRIQLRNDSLANWNSSTLNLLKGEVAIATLNGSLAEVRVGTGSGTWANALKLNINSDQVSGLIEAIQGTAKKYQVVANGEGGNSWKLQEAALSGGDWTDVAGSVWTVDVSELTAGIDALSGAIDALAETLNTVSSDYLTSADKTELQTLVSNVSADTLTAANEYTDGKVEALSTEVNSKIDGVAQTLNTVSSDYLTSTDKTELSNALTALDNAKLAKSEFAALSNKIGLSAATAENPVVTKDDIKDLAGAMHFRGAVSDPSDITDPEAGDLVIVTSTSKEYVYNGTEWVELGDENLYATKAEVATISAQLTSDIDNLESDVSYLSGEIDTVKQDYATKTELNAVSAALSSDYQGKIDNLESDVDYLSGQIDSLASDYATKEEVAAVSAALSTDYQGQINGLAKTLNTVSSDYLTSTDKTELETLVNTVSAETLVSANAYTDEKIEELDNSLSDYIEHGKCVQDDLSGYFVFDCGGATLRKDEPQA